MIPSFITGGFNALGNLLNYQSNKETNQMNMQIAQMNNEFNERMLQKQIDYNTEMWHKNNEYNSAKSQFDRWREAGINPYLAMQGQNSGIAQTAGGIHPPTADGSAVQRAAQFDFTGIGQAISQYYQRQRDLADINKTNKEAEGIDIDNQTRGALNRAQIMEAISRTNDRDVRLALTADLHQLNKNMITAQWKDRVAAEQETRLRMESIRLDNAEKAIRNENLPTFMKIQIAQGWASVRLTENNVEKVANDIVESSIRQSGMRVDNRIKKATAQALIDSYKLDTQFKQRTFDARVEQEIMKSLPENFQRNWKRQIFFWRDSHARGYAKYTGE